jgi:hypothetical protein
MFNPTVELDMSQIDDRRPRTQPGSRAALWFDIPADIDGPPSYVGDVPNTDAPFGPTPGQASLVRMPPSRRR